MNTYVQVHIIKFYEKYLVRVCGVKIDTLLCYITFWNKLVSLSLSDTPTQYKYIQFLYFQHLQLFFQPKWFLTNSVLWAELFQLCLFVCLFTPTHFVSHKVFSLKTFECLWPSKMIFFFSLCRHFSPCMCWKNFFFLVNQILKKVFRYSLTFAVISRNRGAR